MKRVMSMVSIAVVASCGLLLAASWMTGPPDELGVRDGRLAPCPDSPNCVSSTAGDPEHFMNPIPFHGPPDETMRRLRQVIEANPRSRIITANETYLHVEFRSLIFQFVDDVEFLIDPEQQLIHFRSASRVGYSDLGANRRRMNHLRDALATTKG